MYLYKNKVLVKKVNQNLKIRVFHIYYQKINKINMWLLVEHEKLKMVLNQRECVLRNNIEKMDMHLY